MRGIIAVSLLACWFAASTEARADDGVLAGGRSPGQSIPVPFAAGLGSLADHLKLGSVAADGSDVETGGDPAPAPTEKAAGEAAAGQEPWVENEGETYRFVGLRGRYVVIPKFMFSLYQADGGSTVAAPGIGLEYAVRRNGFEYDAWLMYASYPMKSSPFKAKSDPDQAYEIVKSELKTLTIGADFLWSTPIDRGFSFVYGGGAGLGLVFGNLYRNQAYPPNGVPGDPETYVKCPRPGSQGDYCGTDNDHYGDYAEPSWLDGGSKPIVFPWIALPQVGLRWKPSTQFAMRLDTGLSFPGPFFFGISGQYGLL